MDGNRTEYRPLGGMSELEPQPTTAATLVQNYTVDARTNGWDNRVGWEKYFPGASTLYNPFATTPRVDSLAVWSRHGGAQEWILYEAGGSLYYVQDFASPLAVREIATGRAIPTPSEAPTQYIPFGSMMVVINGHDAPLLYGAWPVKETSPYVPVYELGWSTPPTPPTPWGVDTSPDTHSSAGKEVGIWAGGAGFNEHGLGSMTSSAKNGYRWKVSFISPTGAESPLSSASSTVEWTTPAAGTFANKRFVPYLEIPLGPAGTRARYLYRTTNLGDGDTTEEVYYFVAAVKNNIETSFYDHFSDSQLGSEGAGVSDSVVMPSRGARYGAVFKGCLFLDGGTTQGTRLYWSLPGKPDQYSALDFADIGTRQGGDIKGLYAHYNFMLVLRENALDIVRGNYTDGFEVRPLAQGIGSSAVGTVATIPDLGVVLLCHDGVYLINGNVDGGGSMGIKRISDAITPTIQRQNKDVMARAVGVYSQKWREYHVYFAADGSDRPSLGVVLHMQKGEWSIREGFPVGAITTNSVGDIIFGHHTGYTGTARDPAGLFVVSRRRACGHSLVTTTVEGQPVYTLKYALPCTSVYRSAWHDFGSPEVKKSVIYLWLYGYTMGDDPITVTVYKDHQTSGVNAPAIRMQRADHADQPVYDKARIDGTTAWAGHVMSVFRVAIDPALPLVKGQGGGASTHFLFEVKTEADFVLTGYGLTWENKNATMPAAKGLL